VVVAVATGVVGLAGPVPAAVATGAAPLVQAAINHVRDVIGRSRLDHQVEIVLDGAEAYGAKTFEDFGDFIEAAVQDDEHRELLARALAAGQDAAMRDKRVRSVVPWHLRPVTPVPRLMTSCCSSGCWPILMNLTSDYSDF